MTRVIDKKYATHESYGVVTLERIGGYTHRLVGTVQGVHHTAFRLKVHRGERTDGIDGEDGWMTASRPLLEIHLSMLQLAELITLQGMGTEVPCTIVQVDGQRMPDPPAHDSKIERVIEESRADLFDGPDPSDEARDELQQLRAEIDGLKVSKAAKGSLLRRLDAAQSKLRMPGVIAHVTVERMGRHLSKAITEARIEDRLGAPRHEPEQVIDAGEARALPHGPIKKE